jgi:rhodanese-related sulfurtransferase
MVMVSLAGGCPPSEVEERLDLEHLKQEIRARHPSVRTISTADLAASLESLTGDPPLLLDVRAADEFAVSHLPRAELASKLTDAIARIEAAEPGRTVILYCSVGYRSADVAASLQAHGYTNVFNLEGSIFQWANEGRTLFRGQMPVKVVHPFDNDWGQYLNRQLWCFAPEGTAALP